MALLTIWILTCLNVEKKKITRERGVTASLLVSIQLEFKSLYDYKNKLRSWPSQRVSNHDRIRYNRNSSAGINDRIRIDVCPYYTVYEDASLRRKGP